MPLLTGAGGEDQDSAPCYAFAQAGDMYPRRHFRSVQDARWKLVYHPDQRRDGRLVPARYELYDLENDPGETTDLAEQHPGQLRRLRGELFGWMNGDWIVYPQAQVEENSEEALEALKALGYIP